MLLLTVVLICECTLILCNVSVHLLVEVYSVRERLRHATTHGRGLVHQAPLQHSRNPYSQSQHILAN